MKVIKNQIALPTSEIEKEFWNKNQIVAGIDEAGRGCLAGPVVAAAIILPKKFENILGFDDSKRLSKKKREYLFDYLIQSNFDYGIGKIDNHKIDEVNILEATHLAIKEAYKNLKNKPEHLLIDGNHFRGFDIQFTQIISGDRLSVSIAAASIIAKVHRDNLLISEYSKNFPEYEFEKNKGYGTSNHIQAIKKYGTCEIHRSTFLKNIINQNLCLF